MHPPILQAPESCPICGMALEPLLASDDRRGINDVPASTHAEVGIAMYRASFNLAVR